MDKVARFLGRRVGNAHDGFMQRSWWSQELLIVQERVMLNVQLVASSLIVPEHVQKGTSLGLVMASVMMVHGVITSTVKSLTVMLVTV